MYKPLTAALLLAFAQQAAAVSTIFTYQGSLVDAGVPATGSYDLRFELIGPAPTATPITLEDVAVSGGVFSVELDFDVPIASSDYSLSISVRPGNSTGAFTALTPTTPIRPAPQAQVAAIASEAVTVGPNAVDSAGIVDGSVGVADINTAQVQARVNGTCAAGNAIRTIAADGTVSCEAAGGVTSIATGAGLTGGPITTSGTISIDTGAVTSAMIQNFTINSNDVNPDSIQLRVNDSCVAGSAIRAIAGNGNVTCQALPAAGWLLAGNAGTNPASNFLGTTDAQPLELRTANARSLRIEPSPLTFGSPALPITVNMLGGSRVNEVTAGVRGATIAGGGVVNGGEPTFSFVNPNRVTDSYGTVGGGYNNRAGNDAGLTSDAGLATVAGGGANSATGPASTIGGGFRNVASGGNSTVGGGTLNCAGGDFSWAGGRRAKVRPGADPGGADSCSGLTYPGGVGDQGTFVWADSQNANFVSTDADQFMVRAANGFGLNTAPPTIGIIEMTVQSSPNGSDASQMWIKQRAVGDGILLNVANGTGSNNAGFFIDHYDGTNQARRMELAANGSVLIRSNVTGANTGVTMAANGGSFTSLSDRNLKMAIEAVDSLAILERVAELPISTWSYIAQGEGIRHIGPMAQDFMAAFAVGETDTGITTIDADGVALAAIQGLNRKLEAENAELRRRLEAIEARLEGR